MSDTTKPKRLSKKDKFIYPNSDLLCDMDGVVVDFTQSVIDEYNKRHNGSIHISEWTKFDVVQVFGKEIHSKMHKIFNEPGFFATLKPYPGAVDVINKVCKILPVTVCSAPTKRINEAGNKELNPHCAFEKFEWVHKYIPELSNSIILASAKHKVKSDFLVDDGMHNISAWAKAHPEGIGIVIDRPWNQTKYLAKNCRRITLENLPDLLIETLREVKMGDQGTPV